MDPRLVLIRRTSPCTLHLNIKLQRTGKIFSWRTSLPALGRRFDTTTRPAKVGRTISSSARPRFLNFPKTSFTRPRFAPPPTREPTEGDDLREQRATCDMVHGAWPYDTAVTQILETKS